MCINNKDNISNSSELIAKIKVGETPRGVKISPDEKYVLVAIANEVSGTISIIDFKKMTVIKEVPVGKVPHNIVFSTDYNNKKLAYITLQGDDKVITMNMTSFDKIGEIIVSKGPHNLDITPDGKYLFVANAGSSDIAVLDIANKQVIKKIPVSTGHHGIDVSPNGKMVYVSGIGSDKVNVIDPIKLELVKQIDVGNGPHGIRTNIDGKLLYVDVTSTNKVVLIDTEQLKIIDYIDTGKTPFWIAI
ncbi:MAG: YncE family protein, partial [Nitrososphaeraceae archaeon]